MSTQIISFSPDLAKQLYESGEEFCIDFDLAWAWIGYARKDNARKKLTRNFRKDVDYYSMWRNVRHDGLSSASQVEKIMLTIDCFKSLGMMAGTDKGREIREYFLDCERVAKKVKFPETLSGQFDKTPQSTAIETLSVAIDCILSGTAMNPQLVAGIKAEAIATSFPEHRKALEAVKQNLLLPTKSKLHSPTDLAELWEERNGEHLSAQAMNKRLESAGLQRKTGEKSPAWEAIGRGSDHSELLLDTAKGHGKSVQRLMWFDSVLELL